ncbi:MAG: hypothetical protein HY662_03395, partial [Chloroflexi bacterium]|nr:hypothetical protein [Chloroflexota bacterium]
MKIARLYTGTDGESHFEDVDIPLKDIGRSERRSDKIKTTGIIFRDTGADFDAGWHTAPARQFVITLAGQAEIEL